jgi:hypothetical protein
MLLCEWLLLYCCSGGGSAAELAAADRGSVQTQPTGRFKPAAVVLLLLEFQRELT